MKGGAGMGIPWSEGARRCAFIERRPAPDRHLPGEGVQWDYVLVIENPNRRSATWSQEVRRRRDEPSKPDP